MLRFLPFHQYSIIVSFVDRRADNHSYVGNRFRGWLWRCLSRIITGPEEE